MSAQTKISNSIIIIIVYSIIFIGDKNMAKNPNPIWRPPPSCILLRVVWWATVTRVWPMSKCDANTFMASDMSPKTTYKMLSAARLSSVQIGPRRFVYSLDLLISSFGPPAKIALTGCTFLNNGVMVRPGFTETSQFYALLVLLDNSYCLFVLLLGQFWGKVETGISRCWPKRTHSHFSGLLSHAAFRETIKKWDSENAERQTDRRTDRRTDTRKTAS